MASSGSLNTNAYHASDGTRYLTFSWHETTQSVENNKTTISWTLKGDGTSKQYIESGNFGVIVDGSWWYSSGKWDRIRLYNGTTIASGTHTFTHGADGKKSFTVRIQGGLYNFDVNCTAEKTFELDIIARASQPSCVTYPEHTQKVGEFGDTISIHMNRKNSDFTHTVRYAFGDLSGTCINAETGKAATGIENGFKWKIPESFMDLLPAVTTGSGTIYVDTYHGSTKIGTKSCGFTATVPASVKPTCSMTLEDITGVDDIYGSPVKGLSRIKVTVNAKQAYSSPIASYTISVNGSKYFASTATTGVLKNSGSVPVTVTVTDKRGRSGSASYNMNVQEYNAPAVTKLTAARCNQDGTPNKRGVYVKVTFSASVYSMSGKNTALYYLLYKKTSETTYSKVSLSDLTNNFAPANYTYIFAAAAGNSYDVVIQAVDRHTSSNPSEKSAKAPTASAIFSWRGFKSSSGTQDGAGIGKVPEKPNCLQVGWETEFDNDITMIGAHAFYGAQGLIDTRDTNETPEWYMTNHGRGVVWEFKTLTVIGFTNPVATFGALQTIIPWKDSSGGLPRQVVYEKGIRWTRIALTLTSWGAWASDLLRAYPVGSVYIAYHHTNPATLFGGTWQRIENAFLWAVDSSGTIGQTGGEKTHTLTVNEIPAHSHESSYTGDTPLAYGTDKIYSWYSTEGTNMAYGRKETGGGQAHNNMPPYIQVSVWRRTA